MKHTMEALFAHERQAMLEALVRDIRRESEKSRNSQEWAEYHRWNAYMVGRVLCHLFEDDEAGLPQDAVYAAASTYIRDARTQAMPVISKLK